jgi:hypothetical protein
LRREASSPHALFRHPGLRIFERRGHMLVLEQPDAFAAAAAGFLHE